MAANRHGMALAMFMSLLGWEAESTPGGTRRSQVTKALTRRDTLAMLTLALTLGPVSARALIAPATPASLALPVSDLLTFDPQVRKNADGTVVFNLAFRVDADSGVGYGHLERCLRLAAHLSPISWAVGAIEGLVCSVFRHPGQYT